MKLAINLPLLAFWQSFGEALSVVRGLQPDPAWVVQLFSETAGAPNVLKVKADAVAAVLGGDDNVETTFAVDAMRKDLQLVLAHSRLELPVARQTLAALHKISAAGFGDRDCSFVPAFASSNGLSRSPT